MTRSAMESARLLWPAPGGDQGPRGKQDQEGPHETRRGATDHDLASFSQRDLSAGEQAHGPSERPPEQPDSRAGGKAEWWNVPPCSHPPDNGGEKGGTHWEHLQGFDRERQPRTGDNRDGRT